MRKRQIFIELTPLLDVILILLFVLLVQSRGQVEASARSAHRDGPSHWRFGALRPERDGQRQYRHRRPPELLGLMEVGARQ